MFCIVFLALSFSFAMGLLDHTTWGPKGPPLVIQVDNCCVKDILPHIDMNNDKFNECFHMEIKPQTCDRDVCIAANKGYASSDGTIDKKLLQETLKKDFKDNDVALKAILENCVNGDLSKFGENDTCEFTKRDRCIQLQVIQSCDDWKASENCKKLQTRIDYLV